MFKKFTLLLIFLIIILSFSCFAAETFEYDNILYTIELVTSEDGISSQLVLTAVGFADSSSVSDPPKTFSANEIYELLGYDDSEKESTDISNALSSLGEAPLTVEKSDALESLLGSSSSGYFDENGLYIPYSLEEILGQSAPAPVSKPDENGIKVVLRENLTEIETTVSFPDQKPVIVNGRTMIPARGVFEQLGYIVDWNDETSTASVSGNGITVSIPINGEVIYKNNKEIKLDVPAQLIGGRTMIPLRAVSRALGLQVEWVQLTNTVIIYHY